MTTVRLIIVLQLPFRKLSVKRQTCKNILKVRRTARNIIEKGSSLTDQFLEAFNDIEDIIDDINSILFAGKIVIDLVCSVY